MGLPRLKSPIFAAIMGTTSALVIASAATIYTFASGDSSGASGVEARSEAAAEPEVAAPASPSDSGTARSADADAANLKPAIIIPTRARPVVIRRGPALLKAGDARTVRFVIDAPRSVQASVASIGGEGKRAISARLNCNGERIAASSGTRAKKATFRAVVPAGRCALTTTAGTTQLRASTTIVVRPS